MEDADAVDDTSGIGSTGSDAISLSSSRTSGSRRQRKNASDVFRYVVKLDNGSYRCMLCAEDGDAHEWLCYATTNFRNHLLGAHPDRYRSGEGQSTLDAHGFVRRTQEHPTSYPAAMTQQEKLVCDERLVSWIVAKSLPFATVDHEEFVSFCAAMRPDYAVPCQQTIRNRVLERWRVEKVEVRSRLLREVYGRRASFTTDMWTSPAKHGYMVVTMHFIDSEWVMQSVIIAFVRVMYPHTGERLAAHLIRAVEDMDALLLMSIWTVTADNASNNGAMVGTMNQQLQGEIDRLSTPAQGRTPRRAHKVIQLRCFAHVLQLAVKEGLEKCDFANTTIGHFRDLVKKVSESTKLSEALEQVCKDLKEKWVTLKLDVVTRWNSTWVMLESVLTLRRPLDELLRRIREKLEGYIALVIKHDDVLAGEIEDQMWKAVKSFCNFLKPFREATEMLSASTYPTYGMLLLTYHLVMLHTTESIRHPPDDQTLSFARAVKAKLDEYAPVVNTKEARIAALLDPRVKKRLSILVNNLDEVKNEITEEYNEHYRQAFQEQQESRTGPPSAKKKKGESLVYLLALSESRCSSRVGDRGDGCSSEDHEPDFSDGAGENFEENREIDPEERSFVDELERWLQPSVGMSEMTSSRDVCLWFQFTGDSYPRIKLMAQDYLAITATSVPSEIAFSAAGTVVSNRRARLGDDTVTAICELKSFLKFNHPHEAS